MRHYLFELMLAGQCIWYAGLSQAGRPQPQRITLSMSAGSSGLFRFRICEGLTAVRRASLLFRAYNMTADDRIEVHFNGEVIAPPALRFRTAVQTVSVSTVNIVDHEKRIDARAGVDKSTHKTADLSSLPAVPESYMTGWFKLTAPPVTFGDNCLQVTLIAADSSRSGDILIEEIEVHVDP